MYRLNLPAAATSAASAFCRVRVVYWYVLASITEEIRLISLLFPFHDQCRGRICLWTVIRAWVSTHRSGMWPLCEGPRRGRRSTGPMVCSGSEIVSEIIRRGADFGWKFVSLSLLIDHKRDFHITHTQSRPVGRFDLVHDIFEQANSNGTFFVG